MTETLYDVLEVPEDASQREIRRAYRQKVKESHPDVSDHPDAAERFRKIRRAHEVLTDPDERDRYDDLGHDAYMEWFSDDGSSGTRPGSGEAGGASGGSSTSGQASPDDSRASSAGGTSGSASGRSGSTASGTGSASTSSGGARSSSDDSASSQSTGTSSGSASSSAASGSSTASRSSAGSTSGDPGATDDSSTDAPGQASGGADAGGSGDSAASASTDAGGGTSAGGAASGVASTRMGDAVDQEAVAEEAGRWRKKWQAASRGGGGESGAWSSGRGPDEDLEPERVTPGIATKIRSRDAALLTTVLLVAYPIFVYSSVAPGFPLVVNGVVGLATVFVVVYALTEPTVSLVVFGVWSLLTPLLLRFLGVPLGAPTGILAAAAAWVPFILAALLTLAMPD